MFVNMHQSISNLVSISYIFYRNCRYNVRRENPWLPNQLHGTSHIIWVRGGCRSPYNLFLITYCFQFNIVSRGEFVMRNNKGTFRFTLMVVLMLALIAFP